MERHPPRLIVLYPIWQVRGCRSVLTWIDDALIVHVDPDGRFTLGHRPLVKLVSKGPRGYLATLLRIARELERDYRFIIVDKNRFLDDLIALALTRDTLNARRDVAWARQVIDERGPAQITDHLFEAPAVCMMERALVAGRERRTRAGRYEQPGLNMMYRVPTPRIEQLWHSFRRMVQPAAPAGWPEGVGSLVPA